jgi:hypothetical protein
MKGGAMKQPLYYPTFDEIIAIERAARRAPGAGSGNGASSQTWRR